MSPVRPQTVSVSTRNLTTIISRYLGGDLVRTAMYMLQQPDFDKAVRTWLADKDKSAQVAEEKVWYVAATKEDGGIPMLRVAVENKMFLVEADAKVYAASVSALLDKPHSVYEFKAVITL